MENVVKNIAFNAVALKVQVEVSNLDYDYEDFKNEVEVLIEDSPWSEFKDSLDFSYQHFCDPWIRCEKRYFILIPIRGVTIGY